MLFSYRSGYSKIKFQSIDEKKGFATGFMIRGFFFVFSRSVFGFRGFRSFSWLNGSISKKSFFSVSWVRILSKKGWIYGNLKKVRREKSREIFRNLCFSRFFSVGSKTIRINSVGQKDSILGAATQKPRIWCGLLLRASVRRGSNGNPQNSCSLV